MKLQLKYILIFCFVLALFNSCKRKYEEGPLINFGSKCKRIAQRWEIETMNVGGVDSTSYTTLFSDSGYRFSYFQFYDIQNKGIKACETDPGFASMLVDKSGKEFSDGGRYYSLSHDEKYIRFAAIGTYSISKLGIKPVGPFLFYRTLDFRIRRLTKDQMWLDITYEGVYSWMHLKRK